MFKILFKILLLLFLYLQIHANDMEKNVNQNIFIETRDYISDYLIYFSDNLDYFITKEKKTRKNKSLIKLSLSIIKEEKKDIDNDQTLKISIRLPNTERKLKIIIIDNKKKKKESKDKSVELEYSLISDIQNSLYAKVGLKIKSNLERYITLKYKLSYILNHNIRSNFIQDFTYSSDEKFTSTSSIDFIKYIKYPFYIKSYNEFKWGQKKEENQFFYSLSLFQKLKYKDYITYEINTTKDYFNNHISTKDYQISFTYRSYIKEWLYYEIIPKIIYKKENNFSPVNQIRFNFSMSFNE